MLLPDANGEIFLFNSKLIKVYVRVETDFLAPPSPYIESSNRIVFEDGSDVTNLVSDLTITSDAVRAWAEFELKLPGYDGRFCALQYPLL